MNGPAIPSALEEMFRPPVNRAMRALDRAYFQKTVSLTAAKVHSDHFVSACRTELYQDVLKLERMSMVKSIKESEFSTPHKALLLDPRIKADDVSTWSPRLHELVEAERVSLIKYDLTLDYGYWTYHDIMSSILPEEQLDDLPTGFSIVGHIAHLNLRENYLPYKTLIAEVLIDKNPNITTVINKIDEVGETSEYRTFNYELLAGDPNMNVEARESDCTFKFDYSKVYWNPRLGTEHERLVKKFKPGEAVCDVMAGVGPSAIPAGKKKAFVWANDLNPDSYHSLVDAVSRNKVDKFVKPFNQDGRTFIRQSAKDLLSSTHQVTLPPPPSRSSRSPKSKPLTKPAPPTVSQPNTFAHYIMNLPATAITFLDAFVGLHRGHERLFAPHTDTELPMIHVYCFSTKSDDNSEEKIKICREISERIGFTVEPRDEEVEVWDVRDVAPMKRMFCASFRLPREVAFREV